MSDEYKLLQKHSRKGLLKPRKLEVKEAEVSPCFVDACRRLPGFIGEHPAFIAEQIAGCEDLMSCARSMHKQEISVGLRFGGAAHFSLSLTEMSSAFRRIGIDCSFRTVWACDCAMRNLSQVAGRSAAQRPTFFFVHAEEVATGRAFDYLSQQYRHVPFVDVLFITPECGTRSGLNPNRKGTSRCARDSTGSTGDTVRLAVDFCVRSAHVASNSPLRTSLEFSLRRAPGMIAVPS